MSGWSSVLHNRPATSFTGPLSGNVATNGLRAVQRRFVCFERSGAGPERAPAAADARVSRIEHVTTRPEIVCICGSARFVSERRAASWEMSCRGVIVLALSETDQAPTPNRRPS